MNAPATHIVIGRTRRGDTVYYTGAAGDAFVSQDPARALVGWYDTGAEAVAARMNRFSSLHGITFRAAPKEEASQ